MPLNKFGLLTSEGGEFASTVSVHNHISKCNQMLSSFFASGLPTVSLNCSHLPLNLQHLYLRSKQWFWKGKEEKEGRWEKEEWKEVLKEEKKDYGRKEWKEVLKEEKMDDEKIEWKEVLMEGRKEGLWEKRMKWSSNGRKKEGWGEKEENEVLKEANE